jgi:filamentous hemagglutinin family protein
VISILNKGFVGILIVTLVFYLSPAPFAYANPVLQNQPANGGSNVASAGSATVKTTGNTETITQTTGNAVIDWSSFNIGGNQKTKIVDPSSSSLTVNRVHDMNPSQILGTLLSNGNVVLINPNGVFFGQGSTVDVNGIVATSSNVSNANVMNGGKLNFTPGSNPNAGIVNQGTITAANAGLVGLVAPNVINNGIITAKLGTVHLASGNSFTLDMYGDDLMEIQVSDAVNQQLVKNTGTINAAGGTIKLTAAAGRQIVNSLIDVEGELHAPAVAEKGGTIFIYGEGANAVPGNVAASKGIKTGSSTVAVSGYLDASGYGTGQTGGNISVLGDNVGILSGALLDVSGDQGGGNLKIGGDFHGAGTTPTALNVYVDPNSLIGASAITKGNGGNVAVWSDDKNWFYGNIFAEGGAESGNGGFVETSGHGQLDAGGNVDLSAPNGSKGTYLLDPATIEIYGNVTPAFNATDGSISLSSALQLWLDASDTSNVTLSYNTLGVTASGSSGSNTITTSSNIASSLVVGERVQIGGSSDSFAASVNDNASGSGIYTIAGISGTTVTLDANLGSTYSGATLYGGYVSQINDKSGQGNNATQATAGGQPLWISNAQNGLGVMQFNNSQLNLSTLNLGNNFTTFFAVTPNTTTTGGIFDSAPNSPNVFRNFDDAINGTNGAGAWSLWNNTPTVVAATSADVAIIVEPVVSFTPGRNLAIYLDGTLGASSSNASTSSIAWSSPHLGSINNGLIFYNGTLSETIMYNSVLSTNAQALINQYQSAKWGIALTGPGNATGESGLTGAEAQAAMASTQLGATTDGYSVFSDQYLVRLSQTSNIQLAASGNVNIDLQGDNMALAAGRNLSITSTTGSITNNSSGTITTSQSAGSGGNITFKAGTDIALSGLTLNSNGGNIILNSNTANGGGAISITNGGINSGSGNITLGGGANPLIDAAVGDAAYNAGINISGSMNAGGGNIILNGTAINSNPGNTNLANGVDLYASVQTNGAGTITVTGSGLEGVNLGTTVSTANGNITIIGTSTHTNSGGYGYGLYEGLATVQSTGSGNITLTGINNNNNAINNDFGLVLSSGSGSITDVNGNIALNGTGGGIGSYGVFFQYGGQTVQTTGTGTITLTGTGTSGAAGIYFDNNNAYQQFKIGGASDNGNITFNADAITLTGNTAIQSLQTVTFAPNTASTTIGVAGGAGGLQITSGAGSILGSTTAGNIVIGASGDSGVTTIDSLSTATPISFITGSSGGNVVSGALTGTGSASLAFTGPTTLSNNITTANQAITFNSPVTLGADSSLNAGSGTLTFGSSVDGGNNLTATAGTFSLSGVWGGNTPLGAVSLTSTNGLTLPAINAASVFVETTGAAADITLDGNIAASGSAANAITLASGRNFINDSGSNSPLSATSSNWLVYSIAAADDTDGASVMNPATTIYNQAYPYATGISGNTWIYSSAAPVTGGGGGIIVPAPAPTPPVVIAPAPAPTPVVAQTPTPAIIPPTVQQVVVNTPSIWNSDTVVNDPNNVGISFVNQPSFASSDVDVQAPVINAPAVPAPSPSDSGAVVPSNPISGDSTTTQPTTSNSGVVQQPNSSGDVTTDPKKKEDDKKAKARQQSRRELRERIARTGRLWRLRLQDAEAHELQPSS